MDSKKDRRPNFSATDEIILMEEVCKRQHVLFGAFSGAGGGQRKRQEAWSEIASSLNCQSATGVSRSDKEVRKKFENIKTKARSKVSLMRHPPTGGGPPPKDMTPAEQAYIDMIGDSPGLNGIQDGVDSGSNATTVESPVPVPVPSTSSMTPPTTVSLKSSTPTPAKRRRKTVCRGSTGCRDSELHSKVLERELIRIDCDVALSQARLAFAREEHLVNMETARLQRQYYKGLLGLEE